MSTFRIARALVLPVALLVAGAVQASTIQYSTQPAFAAAAGPLTTIDFEGLASPGGLYNTTDPAGLSIDGVSFSSAPGTYIAVVDTAFYAPYYDRGTGDVIHATGGSSMFITFGGAVQSVSALFGTIFRSAVTLTVSLSNGDSFGVALPGGADWVFSGFVSSSANITQLQISGAGSDYILLDRLSYSATAASGGDGVPAPGALALLGLGLAALGARRKRAA